MQQDMTMKVNIVTEGFEVMHRSAMEAFDKYLAAGDSPGAEHLLYYASTLADRALAAVSPCKPEEPPPPQDEEGNVARGPRSGGGTDARHAGGKAQPEG